MDQVAAKLAELLKNRVIVDYETLCRLARLVRATMATLHSAADWLKEAESIGFDLEQQCNMPLIRFDTHKPHLQY